MSWSRKGAIGLEGDKEMNEETHGAEWRKPGASTGEEQNVAKASYRETQRPSHRGKKRLVSYDQTQRIKISSQGALRQDLRRRTVRMGPGRRN